MRSIPVREIIDSTQISNVLLQLRTPEFRALSNFVNLYSVPFDSIKLDFVIKPHLQKYKEIIEKYWRKDTNGFVYKVRNTNVDGLDITTDTAIIHGSKPCISCQREVGKLHNRESLSCWLAELSISLHFNICLECLMGGTIVPFIHFNDLVKVLKSEKHFLKSSNTDQDTAPILDLIPSPKKQKASTTLTSEEISKKKQIPLKEKKLNTILTSEEASVGRVLGYEDDDYRHYININLSLSEYNSEKHLKDEIISFQQLKAYTVAMRKYFERKFFLIDAIINKIAEVLPENEKLGFFNNVMINDNGLTFVWSLSFETKSNDVMAFLVKSGIEHLEIVDLHLNDIDSYYKRMITSLTETNSLTKENLILMKTEVEKTLNTSKTTLEDDINSTENCISKIDEMINSFSIKKH